MLCLVNPAQTLYNDLLIIQNGGEIQQRWLKQHIIKKNKLTATINAALTLKIT